MAKRFTDTEKWRDPWFCSLTSSERDFWSLLLDTCNLAGIWQVNWPLVKFYIPNFKYRDEVFKGRIQKLNSEKWFIPKFVKFQYGELSQTNRLHQRVLFELKKEGVSIPLQYPSQGVKDKDKDMDMDKDMEEDRELATEVPMIEEADRDPREETDLQLIVRGWKMLNGIPVDGSESKAWDRVHFARNAKSAKHLLSLFGFEGAIECMEFVFAYQREKKLDCTLETIVKRSDLFRERLAKASL